MNTKGYKATYNFKCKDVTYVVGETYEINGSLQLCRNGFHFCNKMIDVLTYYPPYKDFVLLEVEALGEVLTDGDKSVTNRLKVLRIIPLEEHKLFDMDANGNITHYKRSDGHEFWIML